MVFFIVAGVLFLLAIIGLLVNFLIYMFARSFLIEVIFNSLVIINILTNTFASQIWIIVTNNRNFKKIQDSHYCTEVFFK